MPVCSMFQSPEARLTWARSRGRPARSRQSLSRDGQQNGKTVPYAGSFTGATGLEPASCRVTGRHGATGLALATGTWVAAGW
jgi:hypothetical protein